jgi:hypothetical protein
MKNFEKSVDEIVRKWTNVTDYAVDKENDPFFWSRAKNYYESTSEIITVRKYCKALQLIKDKGLDNYNLALVTDSGTYEKYCEQFEYFYRDYNEKGEAFEILKEDKFSLYEYMLLREIFIEK